MSVENAVNQRFTASYFQLFTFHNSPMKRTLIYNVFLFCIFLFCVSVLGQESEVKGKKNSRIKQLESEENAITLTNRNPKEWHSNVGVARKVIKKFDNLTTYSAHFAINTKEGKRTRLMNGTVYYQKPGRLRYEFTKPKGNLIVSDGRIMWFYIKRLNIVGKQDLTLNRKKPSGRPIFQMAPLTGVRHLFQRYHYRFDNLNQPRYESIGVNKNKKNKFFIFDMEQREKIGGYEKIKLYIGAKNYLIRKAKGDNGYGKVTTISFFHIKLNSALDGKLFQYKPDNNVSVVENSLVEP